MKSINVRIPATSANLGPGFDVLGVALHLFNDVEMEAGSWSRRRRTPAVQMDIAGEGSHELPHDSSNLVVRAAMNLFDKARRWPTMLGLRLTNRIPLSRGLGSSAAATIAGLCGANALLGRPFKDQELLNVATAMEGHPDNVAPALFGGFCLSGVFGDEVRYLKFIVPSDLKAVVCSPARPLATSKARRVLPSRVAFSDAIFTSTRVAFLIGALLQGRYDWLGNAMEDVLHQPARARLIPGLRDAIASARKSGAWGAALSGAGTSVIALTKPANAARVARAMEQAFRRRREPSSAQVLALENKGARIL